MAAPQQTIGGLDAVHPTRAELGVCIAPLRPAGGCTDRAGSDGLLRADLHVVILCSGGSAAQVVEGTTHHHEPGSLLWIRPGQVHERPPAVEGTVVCFTDAFVAREWVRGPGPSSWILGPDDADDLRARLAVLDADYRRYVAGGTGHHRARVEALVRHRLRGLLLRIGQAPARAEGPAATPHRGARGAPAPAARPVASIQTVDAYAAVLGTAPQATGRTGIDATGLSPRQIIDARLVHEARRLLAYTNLSVAAVGRRLGFIDPATFCTFFVRTTAVSPIHFRAALRS